MTQPLQILVMAGSLRSGSFNHRLAEAVKTLLGERGAEVDLVDSTSLDLPLVNPDLEDEAGPPAAVRALSDRFAAADAFVLASPEYNSSITPVMKNTIDWVSRKTADRAGLAALDGKVVALLSTSPGRLGGLRGLVHLRSILGNLGMVLVPDQYAMSAAHEAFDEDGGLARERDLNAVVKVIDRLLELTEALR